MPHLIIAEHARFTLLRPGVIRVEWSDQGRFEDRPGLRACGRGQTIPLNAQDTATGWVMPLAGHRLRYRPDGRRFHAGNLWLERDDGTLVWQPGMRDEQNLGSTYPAMDTVSRATIPVGVHPATDQRHPNGEAQNLWRYRWGGGEPQEHQRYKMLTLEQTLALTPGPQREPHIHTLMDEHARFPPGPLSHAGYFVWDDRGEPVLDPATGWIAARVDPDALDWHVFAYGADLTRALADVRGIFGAAPMLPRWTLGCWYSRYPTFDQAGLLALIEDFRRHDLPLDALVLDLEWHRHGWHGFDWDSAHIPDPDALLQRLRSERISTALNLHPDAVPTADSRFPAFLAAAGLPPVTDPSVTVFKDFDTAQRRQAEAFLDVLHLPVQQQGVDCWWIDGQARAGAPVIDRQLWTNHIYMDQVERTLPDRRPMVLSRAADLGSQRHPIHFTGDTWSQWEVLLHQVEWTLRAGHAGRSLVSHDVGGHMGPAHHIDPELYARWVQFCALSPIFRLHSANGGERRPWMYGEAVLTSYRTALRLRSELLPYLYTLMRQSHDTLLPMCRSFALACPTWADGATIWDSYTLGDRIAVTPIVQPGEVRLVRLPPGRWQRGDDGTRVLSDGSAFPVLSPITAQPLHWIRSGTILIRQVPAQRAADLPNAYVLDLYPAGIPGTASFELYEDDGHSRDASDGAWTRFTCTEDANGDLAVEIHPRRGTFVGAPTLRTIHLRLGGTECIIQTVRDLSCDQPYQTRIPHDSIPSASAR